MNIELQRLITAEDLSTVLAEVGKRNGVLTLTLDHGTPANLEVYLEAATLINSLSTFPALAPRPESGVMQFGNDWPGIFLRGDHSMAYRMALDTALRALQMKDLAMCSIMTQVQLGGLRDLLCSCDTRTNPEAQIVPISGPFASAVPDVDVPETETLQQPNNQE